MDSDEKSDGQGFVLVGDPAPEEPIVEDRTTYTPETQGQNTPYTSETQDQNTPYTAETQDQNTPPVVEKMTETETLFGDKPAYGSVGSQEPPRIHKSQTGNGANKKISKNVLVIILALLLGFGGGFGGGILAIQNFGGGGSGSNVTVNAKGESLNVTEAVAKKVLPSVVGITATTTTVSQDIFFGPQQQVVSGVGTGIILDTSGYILTNSHVIMDDSKTKLTVLLSDGREVSGSVKWFDTTLDLAIVKISAANLTPAEMGNSDNLKVGQYVAAIGNPLGLEFQGSVTQGVISGLNRTIVATNDNNTEVSMENLVQVDAAINAGNSGGPLLNSSGQVIGINTAKAESGENMGFAIPIDTAKPIIDSIKANGEFNRVYMGVSVTAFPMCLPITAV